MAKKKMVPSDLISSLALYRHARHGALQTKAPDDSPLSSPKAVFLQLPDQCFLARRVLSSARNRSARNGFSLARNSCRLSAASIPGSKLPACSFASSRVVSVSGLPPAPLPRSRFAPVAAASAPGTRNSSTSRSGLPHRATSTPLREFYFPRDRKQNRPGLYSARLPNPPDSPSLPAAALFPGAASDHRSRFATFPVARCSSNLLEPSSL